MLMYTNNDSVKTCCWNTATAFIILVILETENNKRENNTLRFHTG